MSTGRRPSTPPRFEESGIYTLDLTCLVRYSELEEVHALPCKEVVENQIVLATGQIFNITLFTFPHFVYEMQSDMATEVDGRPAVHKKTVGKY